MSERDDLMEFTVTVIRATDRALLCANEDGDEQWIPVSQIHDDSEVYSSTHVGAHVGEIGTLIIPRWLAEERGWT